VRVEVFSKIRHRFLPLRRRISLPAYFARLRSFERSSRKRISSREKSDISRKLRFFRLTGMAPYSLPAAGADRAAHQCRERYANRTTVAVLPVVL
jgi:hypothetical protein